MSKYKRLEKEFQSQGFIYKEIYRNGNEPFAIYGQFKKDRKKPLSYEVIHIINRDATEIMGNPTPATEVYPGSASFGREAFCVSSEERAFEKLVELKAKILALENKRAERKKV
jgi:hypothetical protein